MTSCQDAVTLAGAANFRDLGGYRTSGGGRVRRRRIFRSSSLANLTEADQVIIEGLGIRTVCDLRTRAEVRRHPTNWSQTGARILESSKLETREMLAPLFALGDAPEEEWLGGFAEFYTTVPEIYAEEYAALFAALAEGETPLLINCSAGKDRTGVACALVLRALEVPMETVIEDYMLTAERLRADRAFTRMLSRHVTEDFERLPNYAKAIMLGVNEMALMGAFASIDARYGSLDNYLEQRLGVGRDARESIRHHLVDGITQ